jgi:hypothetical protein
VLLFCCLLLLLLLLLLIESFHLQGVAQDSNDDSDLMPTGAPLPSRHVACACHVCCLSSPLLVCAA